MSDARVAPVANALKRTVFFETKKLEKRFSDDRYSGSVLIRISEESVASESVVETKSSDDCPRRINVDESARVDSLESDKVSSAELLLLLKTIVSFFHPQMLIKSLVVNL